LAADDPFPSEMLSEKAADFTLPDWRIHREGRRCFVFKEFPFGQNHRVMVALSTKKAVYFLGEEDVMLDADMFAEYMVRGAKPKIKTLVQYFPDYNCYAWTADLFPPEAMSEITEAIKAFQEAQCKAS